MANEQLSVAVKLDVEGAKGDAKKLGTEIERSMKKSGEESKRTTDGMEKGLNKTERVAERFIDKALDFKKPSKGVEQLSEKMNKLVGRISAVKGGSGLSGLSQAYGACGMAGLGVNAAFQGVGMAMQVAQTVAPQTYNLVSKTGDRLLHGARQAIGLGKAEAWSEGRTKAEEVVQDVAKQYGEAGVNLSDQELKEILRTVARNTQRGAEQAQRAQSIATQEFGFTGLGI